MHNSIKFVRQFELIPFISYFNLTTILYNYNYTTLYAQDFCTTIYVRLSKKIWLYLNKGLVNSSISKDHKDEVSAILITRELPTQNS